MVIDFVKVLEQQRNDDAQIQIAAAQQIPIFH
jgi:hypothetical protein